MTLSAFFLQFLEVNCVRYIFSFILQQHALLKSNTIWFELLYQNHKLINIKPILKGVYLFSYIKYLCIKFLKCKSKARWVIVTRLIKILKNNCWRKNRWATNEYVIPIGLILWGLTKHLKLILKWTICFYVLTIQPPLSISISHHISFATLFGNVL